MKCFCSILSHMRDKSSATLPSKFSSHPFLLSDWFFYRLLVVATKPHAVHQLKLLHLNHSHTVCTSVCVFSQSCVPTDKGAHDFCLCFSVHFLWLWYMCVHILVHLCVNIQTWLFVCVCVICNCRMDGKRERKRENIFILVISSHFNIHIRFSLYIVKGRCKSEITLWQSSGSWDFVTQHCCAEM